jgi:type IV pilus biogenesis protein CpaD/CtpE
METAASIRATTVESATVTTPVKTTASIASAPVKTTATTVAAMLGECGQRSTNEKERSDTCEKCS